MTLSQITTERMRNYSRSGRYRLDPFDLFENLDTFSNDIPYRQRIPARYQWPGTHLVGRNRNQFVPEYVPVSMDIPEYSQDLHTFKETDLIPNTKLFGYILKQEYLSHHKGDNKAPLSQGSSTLGAISTFQQGGDGIGTSRDVIEGVPAELRRTSSSVNLEGKKPEGESHKDQENQWKPKRHDIVQLPEALKILETTTACKFTHNETGLGTSQKMAKVHLKEINGESSGLNLEEKQTEICTHKDLMMTNHQTSKNPEESSTSNQLLEISNVLLGEPEDHTCGVCQAEFQEPQQDTNNQWSSTSFDQVLLIEGCGHYFHRQCLQKWILGCKKNSCPFCRQPVYPKKSA
ncbi:hypothetical protein PGTUg99_033328 [Puccinia graminis f. sp. tritici]|uniref:RING-type domain-containing protein n=1 Tax=Puccinia graminis f. sp. tritici TaxID=56615 RepID=A0A5B0RVK1_PUCGR|nr:hypothetical protein PGTUg99_033328 [Puccinia graminis f. sp. tritici]